jgi:hypothetical protein
MGCWTPSKFDTCPSYPDYVQTEQDRINYIISVHEGYSVIGPDGKLYPMIKQHHAYQGDTSRSGIPFGYAAEQLNVIVPQESWSKFSEGLCEDWLGNDPNTYGIQRTDQDPQNNIGRSVDVCYMSNNGRQARGGECDWMTNYTSGPSVPQAQRVSYDSLQSVFNGCKREFYFNNTGIWNAGGPDYWYTDPFGRNGAITPFPGSVRQYLWPVNNDQLGYPLESIALGVNLNWCTTGVHAPN